MLEQVIPVSVLSSYIKQIFDSEELLFNINVSGEVSGIKTSKGITYFDLKDNFALLPCVCFYSSLFSDIKNGDKIIVKGTPNFYVKGGRLSFVVNKVTMDGQGDIYKQFLELKQKLEQEGLFDAKFKQPIPKNINKIGVVSSETGAVIQDIINVATRRNPAINIVLYPAKVQGDNAELEVVNGINFFENKEDVDVIIIARGGGSAEDLNVFNKEVLARRVFECKKPIISAIGHETDFVITDFVADLRAPTPSAAAELVTDDIYKLKSDFVHKTQRFLTVLKNIENMQRVVLQNNSRLLLRQIESMFVNIGFNLKLQEEKLNALNPQKILSMGYAKIEKNKLNIGSVRDINIGDEIVINFKDGAAISIIKEKKWILKKQVRNLTK